MLVLLGLNITAAITCCIAIALVNMEFDIDDETSYYNKRKDKKEGKQDEQ